MTETLNDYKQVLQLERENILRRVEAVINSGLPLDVKMKINYTVGADQRPGVPSERNRPADEVQKEEYPPQSDEGWVSVEYHDKLMADWKLKTTEIVGKNVALSKLVEANREAYRHDTMEREAGTSRKLVDLQRQLDESVIENQRLFKMLDKATEPKEVKGANELVTRAPIPASRHIKTASPTAIIKKVEGTEKGDFDKVKNTKFYGEGLTSAPKGYPKFPSFSGHSHRTSKWIFVKHPPLAHLAEDEKPRLNIRSIRPQRCNLTQDEVWQVRRYLASGRKNRWIEQRLGMSDAGVSQMRTGKSYKKVPPEPKAKPEVHKTTTVHAGEGVIPAGHPLKDLNKGKQQNV